jgi:hypothetical protein
MSQNDEAGPAEERGGTQGRGGGEGQGRGGGGQGRGGGGRGRGRGGGGAGAGGHCVCPQCGHRVPHVRGQPCNEQECPGCGVTMTRDVAEE